MSIKSRAKHVKQPNPSPVFRKSTCTMTGSETYGVIRGEDKGYIKPSMFNRFHDTYFKNPIHL